jgi:glycosyltransferase involved in cell wall biosynthesis
LDEPDDAEDYRLNVYRERKVTRRDRGVGVVYGQGDVFYRNRGRYKIGYTMLEVDGFPEEWVRQANRMDEVWVPSEFNRKGIRECGVRCPVHLLPLGVDIDHFSPRIEGVPEPTGDFVFLTVFEWGERKDPWLLLKIFNDEFRADEPVRLVCKIMNRDGEVDLRTEIRKLQLDASGGRLAFLINHEFPYAQLGVLYRSADCYLSAGRGEGWDMPLMEAMACGLPSIATDWGAHRDYVHEGIAYPLEIRGTVPARAKCPYYEGFRWADPDPDHLRFLLRHVFENQEEARRRGTAAAREMATTWTWDAAAERVCRRLEDIS